MSEPVLNSPDQRRRGLEKAVFVGRYMSYHFTRGTMGRSAKTLLLAGLLTTAGCADYGARDARCTPDSPHQGVSDDCIYADVSGDEVELCIPTVEVAETNPTFQEVFDILVSPEVGCDSATCHGGVANGDIRINQGEVEAAYESLTSSRGNGKTNFYVTPGDPDSSWMHCNVRPAGSEGIIGQVMPQDTGLSEENARIIEDWILNGAPGP